MQIDSPFKNKEPNEVVDGKAYYYTRSKKEKVIDYVPIDPDHPQRGIRRIERTITVPLDGEVIDQETGESDSKYWQSEVVLDPSGCTHVFQITDVGEREIECKKCHLGTTIHLGINFRESEATLEVCLNDHWYLIEPS